jgi:hypothetical protein
LDLDGKSQLGRDGFIVEHGRRPAKLPDAIDYQCIHFRVDGMQDVNVSRGACLIQVKLEDNVGETAGSGGEFVGRDPDGGSRDKAWAGNSR